MQFRTHPLLVAAAIAIAGFATLDRPTLAATPVFASSTISNISYVNWSSATWGRLGAASGLIISNLSRSIDVTYRGEVAPTTQVDDGGIDYWQPAAPFLSTTISNLPPTTDIIALSEDDTLNTLLFSEPVVDPVLLILSLGQPGVGVVYDFDAPFEILSEGTGYWGGGIFDDSEPDVLLGLEGHGAIQFRGVFSSIQWRVQGPEFWHGFTVGIPIDPAGAVVIPEGGAWRSGLGLLLAVAAAGACRGRFARRR